MMRRFFGATALLAFLGSIAVGQNWPSYRGPSGMGIVTGESVPIIWNADGENIAWKAELPVTAVDGQPDHSQSSPIIWEDRVFVTTAFWSRDGNRDSIPEQHVTCYRFKDGTQLWDSVVPSGPWKLGDLRGGYSAPTPCTDGDHVYAFFGSSILAALDFDGSIVWTKIISDWKDFDVCIASSPVLYDGRLYLLSDRNNNKSTLTTFDPATGEVIWDMHRDSRFAHSTPVFIRSGDHPLMLTAGSNQISAFDPSSGELIWSIAAQGDVVSPVYADGRIYTDSGRGGPGWCIEPNGIGELADDCIKWRIRNIPEGLSSPVTVGGLLYRLHNPSILLCVDMASGEELFKKRLDRVSVASSPITLPDGRVMCASAGTTYVIEAGRQPRVIAVNELGEPHMSSPAVSQGRIVLKGSRHLFCIGAR